MGEMKIKGIINKAHEYIAQNKIEKNTYQVEKAFIDGAKMILAQAEKNIDNGINRGDYFILSTKAGFDPKYQKKAMQVMELWDDSMTVSCSKAGCITKPYDWFEKVICFDNITKKSHSISFEDNRTKK